MICKPNTGQHRALKWLKQFGGQYRECFRMTKEITKETWLLLCLKQIQSSLLNRVGGLHLIDGGGSNLRSDGRGRKKKSTPYQMQMPSAGIFPTYSWEMYHNVCSNQKQIWVCRVTNTYLHIYNTNIDILKSSTPEHTWKKQSKYKLHVSSREQWLSMVEKRLDWGWKAACLKVVGTDKCASQVHRVSSVVCSQWDYVPDPSRGPARHMVPPDSRNFLLTLPGVYYLSPEIIVLGNLSFSYQLSYPVSSL